MRDGVNGRVKSLRAMTGCRFTEIGKSTLCIFETCGFSFTVGGGIAEQSLVANEYGMTPCVLFFGFWTVSR